MNKIQTKLPGLGMKVAGPLTVLTRFYLHQVMEFKYLVYQENTCNILVLGLSAYLKFFVSLLSSEIDRK
jgi:hypothetical protein